MSKDDIYIGIDVSKDHLDVCISTDATVSTVANDSEGIALLAERFVQIDPTLVVMEATGGYESALAAQLALHNLQVAVVNPKHARDFARAIGRLAKTDAIDAAVLAQFAHAVRPQPKTHARLPSPAATITRQKATADSPNDQLRAQSTTFGIHTPSSRHPKTHRVPHTCSVRHRLPDPPVRQGLPHVAPQSPSAH